MNTHRVSLSCSRVFFQFILAATAVFVAACAGSYGGGTTQPVSVQISPTSASVQTGQTQQFAATVSYATNTAVTWQVNGTTGGDAAHGTVSAAGLYTAPGTVPNPASITVTAVSQADPTKMSPATVTITALPVITVTVSPKTATVVTGLTQQFTATVANTSNTAVTWQVNGAPGGNTTIGTISATGLYTAPAAVPIGAVTVKAISVADATQSDTAAVTVVPPVSVTVNPATPSVAVGTTQQFAATVTNTSNTAVIWQVNGVNGGDATHGTISATGLFTAPTAVPTPATVTVTAISQADNTKSGSTVVTITVAASVTVTVSPKRAAITTGQTQTFTPTVTGDPNTNVTWEVDTVPGGNATVGTITAGGVYTPPTTAGVHNVVARSVANTGAVSAPATIGVTDLAGVYTYHNDLSRDGVNSQEYGLTTATVAPATFGKLFSCAVDGAVYSQPLWVANVNFSGVKHNVLIVATQHDTMYAFDADANPCTMLWKQSLFNVGAETWIEANNDVGCPDVEPDIGILGTPVIDPATNTIYAVSKSKNTTSLAIFQRIHALDLVTGAEKLNGPTTIAGSVNLASFDPQRNNQRAGLALVNGKVYIAWASHCDNPPYQGWVFGYTASDLSAAPSVFTTAPHAPTGVESGIWMAGGAPAADASNNIYLITGNGTFDANSATAPNDDYGDSFLKLGTTSGISVADYFTPSDFLNLQSSDQDFGSGGAAILVDQTTGPVQHLVIGAGKGGILFLLNRDNMGHTTSNNGGAIQQLTVGPSNFSTPVFWQNHLYFAGGNTNLQSFAFDPTTPKFLSPASSISPDIYGFPGATPSLSANGTSNGIIWALNNNAYCTKQSTTCGPAILRAYDATNVATELWHSDANAADAAGNAVKFTVPTVANGKVYVGTRGNDCGLPSPTCAIATNPGELDVYGLKPN